MCLFLSELFWKNWVQKKLSIHLPFHNTRLLVTVALHTCDGGIAYV